MRTRRIEIRYDVVKELLALEKLDGGRSSRAKVRPQKGTLKLRVLLDRCSVGLFANDGQGYLMGGAWPDRNQPALECFDKGGSAVARSIGFCRLKSVWKKQ